MHLPATIIQNADTATHGGRGQRTAREQRTENSRHDDVTRSVSSAPPLHDIMQCQFVDVVHGNPLIWFHIIMCSFPSVYLCVCLCFHCRLWTVATTTAAAVATVKDIWMTANIKPKATQKFAMIRIIAAWIITSNSITTTTATASTIATATATAKAIAMLHQVRPDKMHYIHNKRLCALWNSDNLIRS